MGICEVSPDSSTTDEGRWQIQFIGVCAIKSSVLVMYLITLLVWHMMVGVVLTYFGSAVIFKIPNGVFWEGT